MQRNPNPQGKGLVPVLQSLQNQQVRKVILPKQIDQIEMELFTSLFVLQGELRFNPVPGRSYWLYETATGFRLLMVGPDEWHSPYPGRFTGECVLRQDRTWTLALDPGLAADEAFMARIDAQREQLQQRLEGAKQLEDVLPVYEASLGYHSRVMAYILGKSLFTSMELSGINSLDYKEAKGLLDYKEAKGLLTHGGEKGENVQIR